MQPFNQLYRPFAAAPAAHAIPANMGSANRHLLDAIRFANEDTFYQHMEQAIADGADFTQLEQRGEFVLTIAVERNSVKITQHLLARGASLPFVENDGVDLVMKAAANGNAELIALLIDLGGMLPDSFDANWMTPLHYAINAGSLPAAKALIDRDADLESITLPMNAEALAIKLGATPGAPDSSLDTLSGKRISPLMQAVATGATDIAALLLKAGANPTNGEPSPLLLAISRNDKKAVEMMLPCVPLKHPLHPTGSALMEHAIHEGCDIEILRLLAEPIEALDSDADKDETLNRLLVVAVDTGNVHASALMLYCGAKPEQPEEEEKLIWTLAAKHDDGQLLDVLSVCHADHLREAPSNKPSRVLSELCFLIEDFPTMAANGLFASQIKHLIAPLQEVKALSNELSGAQLRMETAFVLHHSTELHTVAEQQAAIEADDTSDHPDIIWIALLPDEFCRQAEWLSKEADDCMSAFERSLTEAVSFSYFEKLTQACPENMRFQAFMIADLMNNHGLPTALASLIATAWNRAARATQTDGEAPEDLPSANQFTTRMAANLISSAIASQLPMPGSLLSHCFKSLPGMLAPSQLALKRFIANPGSLLRSLENRNNLRPVNIPVLAKALCTQLGLSLPLSTRIATAWSHAITAGASQSWNGGLANQHRHIDRAFASELSSLLHELRPNAGSPSLPLPESALDALLAWCAQFSDDAAELGTAATDNRSDSAIASTKRRRDPNDRDALEPRAKKPRDS